MSPAAAIVGQAWRTPLGPTVDGALTRLRSGERAACASPRAAGYACSIVAPIAEAPAKSRQARFLRRMGLFGLEVARESLSAAAPALAVARVDRDRIGLFAGVGGLRAHWDDMMKGLEHQADDGVDAWQRGLRDVHPYWMLRHLSNNVHALAAMELGVRGEGATYGGATGGAQALAAAARALADGAIDAALVVAYDSLLEPETLVELGERRAATRETDLARVAPAYAPDAAGFVPGEAAGAVVVVRAGDAPSAIRVAAAEGADGERAEPSTGALATTLRVVLGEHAPEIAAIEGAARTWPDLDGAERALLAELVRWSADAPLGTIADALGQVGAATSVIQAIALGAQLGPGEVGLGLSTGAPGLCAAIRVERPA